MAGRRRGLAWLEVLVVVGVVATLIGLLLPAVQAARAAAVRVKSANQLRQIAVAAHNYAATNDETLPGYGILVPGVPGYGSVPFFGPGTFYPLLQYLEAGNIPTNDTYDDDPLAEGSSVPAYQSPADPSLVQRTRRGDISYIANHQVFRGTPRLGQSFPDGTACTIAFAERYARCGMVSSIWHISLLSCGDDKGSLTICSAATVIVDRRATFADPEYDDVLPVTVNGVTTPSVAGRTFQVAPAVDGCDYRVPQTPHTSGMLTAYLDGSVRTTRPGIAPEVFWAAVTPAGGEVTTLD